MITEVVHTAQRLPIRSSSNCRVSKPAVNFKEVEPKKRGWIPKNFQPKMPIKPRMMKFPEISKLGLN